MKGEEGLSTREQVRNHSLPISAFPPRETRVHLEDLQGLVCCRPDWWHSS
jgi:hypothetical protein